MGQYWLRLYLQHTIYTVTAAEINAFLVPPISGSFSLVCSTFYGRSGELVQLREDIIRNFKFKENFTATGNNSGNDFLVIRYVDIAPYQG